MAIIRLDMLGEMCPIPVAKSQIALKNMTPADTLILITDHSCVESNIRSSFSKKTHTIQSAEVMIGIWEVTIRKKE
ncbi:sulfurtransferase TusA family protein [Paenibacillus sp. OSY-SE]|uniref:sulfurtransferase TusA family protein n=1 Tax=Paenibacillus sp. OSY-SE TaxID=1196323 RepID=UPI0002F3C661|nr:sulfurtransferase TusA family protein [Paenibacillus sp. OSY-SE]